MTLEGGLLTFLLEKKAIKKVKFQQILGGGGFFLVIIIEKS
jgi:hypothetical protein